jgi:hypothetical protein
MLIPIASAFAAFGVSVTCLPTLALLNTMVAGVFMLTVLRARNPERLSTKHLRLQSSSSSCCRLEALRLLERTIAMDKHNDNAAMSPHDSSVQSVRYFYSLRSYHSEVLFEPMPDLLAGMFFEPSPGFGIPLTTYSQLRRSARSLPLAWITTSPSG